MPHLRDSKGRFWDWTKTKIWTVRIETRLRYLVWIGASWDDIAMKLSKTMAKPVRPSACKAHADKMHFKRSPFALACIKSKASLGHDGRKSIAV